ncbi:MAG: hypothetical protein KME06_12500 [Kastovskya adunca ATA6-11-RM4]|jgi:hypothetical protein|nr:hypothetical protein [Kastovskya adunca ATA6-11-RM4]
MVDPIDDIALQARQGSVAAIIQILNERLAEDNVRTRAVFAEGVLQLLCEAAKPEQLEQSTLVAKVRQNLEEIAPRNIRRVRINSRIVREQQLLWLEEINRDPETQLLWSEEITLAKPNFFKRRTEERKRRLTAPKKKPALPKVASTSLRGKRTFWQGIAGGAGISVAILLVAWLLYSQLGLRLRRQGQTEVSTSTVEAIASPSPAVSPSPTPDPFVEAVRLAEQAAVAGQTANTPAQWLELAATWQRASDLMGAVPPNDPAGRYKTAQNRMVLYRQNSEAAQKAARASRS